MSTNPSLILTALLLAPLPSHALAEATMDTLRAVGIDTRFVLRTETGRLGLYFLETGANQRPSNVLYDRADSAKANAALLQQLTQQWRDGWRKALPAGIKN